MDPTCRKCDGPCDCGPSWFRNTWEPISEQDTKKQEESERRRVEAKRKAEEQVFNSYQQGDFEDSEDASRALLKYSRENNLAMVTLALNGGAKVDVQPHFGTANTMTDTSQMARLTYDGKSRIMTPFLWACYHNNIEMVKFMLKFRPNVDANGGGTGDTAQFTPLHWAARHNNEEMVRLLFGAGATLTDDGWGYYPDHHAKNEVIKQLLARKK